MKTLRRVTLILVGCTLAASAGAQAPLQPANPRAEWRVIERLPVGTAISVKGKGWHRFRCKVVSADEGELQCQAETLPGPNLFPPAIYHFNRSEIRQVRLEHPDATAAVAGLALGTVGAVAGVGAQDTPDPLGSLLLGGLGGLIGAGIGHTFPVHGRVIYQP